uniref:hydroxymethylglutaryl-CoA reductase (NADPH) n=1 Tax=viral metagenome TaxID=1070528 RepID=A0A6C0EK57_9ZZZZ
MLSFIRPINRYISIQSRFISIQSRVNNNFKVYNIEDNYDCLTSVDMRRDYYNKKYNLGIDTLSKKTFDYNSILHKNCENVIGYTSIPTGLVGPVPVNQEQHFIPISTTEGALVGSINRGASLISKTSINGINAVAIDKGITRSPIIDVLDIENISTLHTYINNNFNTLKTDFKTTTNYGELQKIDLLYNGSKVHLRISALTGDAMGMNIISKGSQKIVNSILNEFPHFKILSLSGNTCSDKKPSAINWINGRGKTVLVNTKLDIKKLETLLKHPIEDIVQLNIQKNLIGSALAGSIGGFNSHAANTIAGIFVATGQDIAQVGTSSVCITDYSINNNYLNIDLTMPSLEIATVGGGTSLKDQQECLKIMGIDIEKNNSNPGYNSMLLSKIIASTVLCGELSLMSSLTSGTLVKSHMKFNRGAK